MRIEQKKTALVKEAIEQEELLFQAKNLHEGPVHLLFPQELKTNIEMFRSTFEELEVPYQIYFALKASSKLSFSKQAKKEGIRIDVASRKELVLALEAGFQGKEIECSGPKNNSFIQLATLHGCLISIDSISELQKICDLTKILNTKADILIRISDLEIKDRKLTIKNSKFGIRKSELEEIYNILNNNSLLILKGFHFHNDGYNSESKAGFLEEMLEVCENAYTKGFEPTLLNIGGSWRTNNLENPQDWYRFVELLESELIKGANTQLLGNETLGMKISEKGRILGREAAIQKWYPSSFEKDLNHILRNDSLRERELRNYIQENLFEVLVEPGFSLLQNCGITLVNVIGTKHSKDGDLLIISDANIYNLSTARLFEITSDPILIKKRKTEENGSSGFIVGNLCMEDDIIIKKRVYFDSMPEEGDLLCFLNTAAYISHFEDASPILQAKGKSICLIRDKNTKKLKLISEEQYNPYSD